VWFLISEHEYNTRSPGEVGSFEGGLLLSQQHFLPDASEYGRSGDTPPRLVKVDTRTWEYSGVVDTGILG
jgi:hypothetical protein